MTVQQCSNRLPPSPRRRGDRGYTLLEMMLALAILSLVLLMAFGALQSTTSVASMESARNELDRSGVHAIETMLQELKAASILGVSGDGTLLSFQVPADLDGNGTVLDSAGNPEFGISDGAPQAGTITLQFTQNPGDVLNETTLRRDLNNDGDTADVFDRGRIVRTTTANNNVPATLSGYWVVQPSGNWGGDLDADADNDPLFALNGKRLWIDLWMMGVDQAGNNQFVRCRTSLHLRN